MNGRVLRCGQAMIVAWAAAALGVAMAHAAICRSRECLVLHVIRSRAATVGKGRHVVAMRVIQDASAQPRNPIR